MSAQIYSFGLASKQVCLVDSSRKGVRVTRASKELIFLKPLGPIITG